MLLSLLIQPAFPCAGIFHDVDNLAESDHQQVILRDLGGEIEASYSVVYEGDATDFGWVIPIFGAFSSLEDGDQEVFDDLDAMTEPTVRARYDHSDDGGSGGCTRYNTKDGGALNGADRADTGYANDATVIAEGFTGTYSYTVLEADTADALSTWLSDNGWSIESAGTVIDDYVAEGGVQFVAISLTGGAETDAAHLPPVSIRYAGDSLRFPAKMAYNSMVETLRTTLFVLGSQPATVAGWSSTTVPELEGDLYSDDAQGLFDEAMWEAGGYSPGYLLTYASDQHLSAFSEPVVTRFDAFVSRDVHTLDPTFALDGTDSVEMVITMVEPGADDTSEAWLLLPLLAGCGLWRRRRG